MIPAVLLVTVLPLKFDKMPFSMMALRFSTLFRAM